MNRMGSVCLVVLVLGLLSCGSATARPAGPLARQAAGGPRRLERARHASGADAGVARADVSRSATVTLTDGSSISVGVVWVGNRTQVRAQKLSPDGARQWGPQGVLASSEASDADYPVVADDGAGGAIVAWEDDRSGETDIYAQRVDAGGFPWWAPGGVGVCTAPFWQGEIMLAADGNGGATVGWIDGRSGVTTAVYAQRLDRDGAPLWVANGVAAGAGAGNQTSAVMTSDGAAGAFLAWVDARGTDADIYAQWLDASSFPHWTSTGAPVCTSVGSQGTPTIAPAIGGVVVAWADPGTHIDIRAQRLGLDGATRWPAAGVSLCTTASDRTTPIAVADGSGGAIVAWQDWRGADENVYAQRVDSLGAIAWAAAAMPVCTAPGGQGDAKVCADGAGGAIFAWSDFRALGDVYAQRLDGSGARVWSPANGVLVCGAPDLQGWPSVAPDSLGGVVISWLDYRSYYDRDVYAQRIDASGVLGWDAGGRPAIVAPGKQMNCVIAAIGGGETLAAWNEKWNGLYEVRACVYDSLGGAVGQSLTLSWIDTRSHLAPMVVADGAGGGVVAWGDLDSLTYTSNIRAQRVNASGVAIWPDGGVHVCDAVSDQWVVGMAPDSAGGAVLLWMDMRYGQRDLFAQAVDYRGVGLWGVDGAPVCTAAGGRQTAALVPDGSGGVIAVWDDSRSGSLDIYGQRLDASGAPQWAADGVALCTANSQQYSVAAASDGEGGAVLAWSDDRDGSSDLYVQRVNGSGVPQWTADGVALCTVLGFQEYAQVVPDGAHGAIVMWDDARVVGLTGLYAQHVDAAGVPQWTANGKLVGGMGLYYSFGSVVAADGAGGAVFEWSDWTGGVGNADIVAQRFDPAGNALWGTNGVQVCSAAHDQLEPAVASDGAGGAVAMWGDWRDGQQSMLYKERITAAGAIAWTPDGETGVAMALRIATVIDGRVRIEWQLGTRTPLRVNVYRQDGGDAWTTIGEVTSDANGIVAFDDGGVQPGGRYGYRIGVVQDGAETLSSPEWVNVPSGAVFGLEMPRPNPVAGAFDVAFTLPRAGSVRLELVDAVGRRVLERSSQAMPAGRSVLALAPKGTLRSGLYWLRITSDGHALARKVCVIR